jgi:hypothetical protein
MVKVTRQDVDLNQTIRFTDAQGRLTGEAYRFLSMVRKIVQAVSIVDGEVTTDMLADLAVSAAKLDDGAVVVGKLAAGSIYVDTLFVNNVVKTNAVALNAISELTALFQGSPVGPDDATVLSGVVPVTGDDNTGLLLTFTGFMDVPTADPSNFGYWRLHLQRNGVTIDSTPLLYYDDNFSYQPVAAFVDETPGTDPTYSIVTELNSGLGNFAISGSVLNIGLLKR